MNHSINKVSLFKYKEPTFKLFQDENEPSNRCWLSDCSGTTDIYPQVTVWGWRLLYPLVVHLAEGRFYTWLEKLFMMGTKWLMTNGVQTSTYWSSQILLIGPHLTLVSQRGQLDQGGGNHLLVRAECVRCPLALPRNKVSSLGCGDIF